MDLAIKMNNFGCTLFRSGRMNESYDLFAGALQAFYLKRERGIHGTMSNFLLDPSIQRAFDILTENAGNTMVQPSPEHSVETEISVADELETFIRSDPFIIAEHSGCWDASHHLVMVALLFNNALLLQKQSVRFAKRPIERSIILYSMATDTIFRTNLLHHVVTDRAVSSLVLSVLNNFGYALHQTNDRCSTRLCFSTLQGILEQLGPPQSTQENELRTRVAANVFFFCQSGRTASAGAA